MSTPKEIIEQLRAEGVHVMWRPVRGMYLEPQASNIGQLWLVAQNAHALMRYLCLSAVTADEANEPSPFEPRSGREAFVHGLMQVVVKRAQRRY